jgi:hypothetical protein
MIFLKYFLRVLNLLVELSPHVCSLLLVLLALPLLAKCISEAVNHCFVLGFQDADLEAAAFRFVVRDGLLKVNHTLVALVHFTFEYRVHFHFHLTSRRDADLRGGLLRLIVFLHRFVHALFQSLEEKRIPIDQLLRVLIILVNILLNKSAPAEVGTIVLLLSVVTELAANERGQVMAVG